MKSIATIAISTIAIVSMTIASIASIAKVPIGTWDSVVFGSATGGTHILSTVVNIGLTVLIAVGGSDAIRDSSETILVVTVIAITATIIVATTGQGTDSHTRKHSQSKYSLHLDDVCMGLLNQLTIWHHGQAFIWIQIYYCSALQYSTGMYEWLTSSNT